MKMIDALLLCWLAAVVPVTELSDVVEHYERRHRRHTHHQSARHRRIASEFTEIEPE